MSRPECPDEALLADAAIEGISSPSIAEHLGVCPACRERFDGLGALLTGLDLLSSSRPAATATPADTEGQSQPTSVGKYLLVGQVEKREGMTVHRGVHSLIRNEEVFVYLADAPMPGDDASGARFQAACGPLTRFEHPAIARAIDLGFLDDRPYLAIQFVPGQPLDRFLEERTLLTTEAAAVCRGCRGRARDGPQSGRVPRVPRARKPADRRLGPCHDHRLRRQPPSRNPDRRGVGRRRIDRSRLAPFARSGRVGFAPFHDPMVRCRRPGPGFRSRGAAPEGYGLRYADRSHACAAPVLPTKDEGSPLADQEWTRRLATPIMRRGPSLRLADLDEAGVDVLAAAGLVAVDRQDVLAGLECSAGGR